MISFIKIDTQGHEVNVLRGAFATLDRYLSLEMLVEYFPEGLVQDGESPETLMKEIEGHGFKITWPSKEVIDRCLPDNGRHCNLYLVKT